MAVSVLAAAALLAGAPTDQAAPASQVTQAVAPQDGAAPAVQAPPVPDAAPASAQQAPLAPQASPAPAAKPAPGEIVVEGRRGPPPGDPMIAINEKSYEVVQKVDDVFVGPVSMTYQKTVPSPIRTGLRNFLSNINEPVIALNFLLQLHPGKAAETLGRFAINSTVGVGGLIDVARNKPFHLPFRRNGLAYTLGYYGVGPGPYMFLPLVGPTTVRDLFGLTVDRAIMPLAVGKPLNRPAYVLASNVIKSLDDRVQDDARFRAVQAESANPYKDIKDYYMQQRQSDIDALHGKPAHTPAFVPSNEPVADVAPESTVAAVPPVEAAPPAPVSPPPPVFVSHPVVQPLPQN